MTFEWSVTFITRGYSLSICKRITFRLGWWVFTIRAGTSCAVVRDEELDRYASILWAWRSPQVSRRTGDSDLRKRGKRPVYSFTFCSRSNFYPTKCLLFVLDDASTFGPCLFFCFVFFFFFLMEVFSSCHCSAGKLVLRMFSVINIERPCRPSKVEKKKTNLHYHDNGESKLISVVSQPQDMQRVLLWRESEQREHAGPVLPALECVSVCARVRGESHD